MCFHNEFVFAKLNLWGGALKKAVKESSGSGLRAPTGPRSGSVLVNIISSLSLLMNHEYNVFVIV